MSPASFLQPIPLSEIIWQDISMDFITYLPKSHGFEVILVVDDHLSKYFLTLKHPFTSRNVVEVFIRDVAKFHGFPKSIISDRDPIFLNKFWSELSRFQGTTLRMSTSYHPQIDSQLKVVNLCLETFLCCFALKQSSKWNLWLSWAEFWYNTFSHSRIRKIPFKMVYGRSHPSVLCYLTRE